MLRILLFFFIGEAFSQYIEQSEDSSAFYFTIESSASSQTRWNITRVAKLPGPKLPDFYYTFMDTVDDANFCKSQRRILQKVTPKMLEPFKPLFADPTVFQAMEKNTDPVGLNKTNQQLYQGLKAFCLMQGITLAEAAAILEVFEGKSSIKVNTEDIDDTLNSIAQQNNITVSNGTSLSKDIAKDIGQKLTYLQAGTSDLDAQNKLKDALNGMQGQNTPKMTLNKKSIVVGYAYFIQGQVGTQKITTTLLYADTSTYNQTFQINKAQQYISLQSQCQTHVQPFIINYDFTKAPEIQSKIITSIILETAPFFQFANTDPCVESVGWRIKRSRSAQLNGQVNITIPFTPQDVLNSFIQISIFTEEGSTYVALLPYTIKGSTIKMGQITKALQSNKELSALAGITKSYGDAELDLSKLDSDQITQIVQLLTSITNVKSNNLNGFDVIAQRLLSQCSNSLSWMAQKVKSQFTNITNTTTSCGNNICQKGKCNEETQSCQCDAGYAGPQCQYTFEEYQTLVNAQHQVIQAIVNKSQKSDQDFYTTMNTIQTMSTQRIGDETSIKKLQDLLTIGANKINDTAQVPVLLEAARALKDDYKATHMSVSTKSKRMVEVGETITKSIKNLIKDFDQFSFHTTDFSGQVVKVVGWTSKDEINLELTNSIVMSGPNYYERPTFQMKGVSDFKNTKSVLILEQQCEYQGLSKCHSPVIELSLIDHNGKEIPQQQQENKYFLIVLPLKMGHDQVECSWLDKNQIPQQSGCQTILNTGYLYCNCTHLTRFVATSQHTVSVANHTDFDSTPNQTVTAQSSEGYLLYGSILILILMNV